MDIDCLLMKKIFLSSKNFGGKNRHIRFQRQVADTKSGKENYFVK